MPENEGEIIELKRKLAKVRRGAMYRQALMLVWGRVTRTVPRVLELRINGCDLETDGWNPADTTPAVLTKPVYKTWGPKLPAARLVDFKELSTVCLPKSQWKQIRGCLVGGWAS